MKAALDIRHAITRLQAGFPPELRLTIGVGIHYGEAVLGLVGSEKRMEYTAIGDSVNTAKRIQENAAGGQILISAQVLDCLERPGARSGSRTSDRQRQEPADPGVRGIGFGLTRDSSKAYQVRILPSEQRWRTPGMPEKDGLLAVKISLTNQIIKPAAARPVYTGSSSTPSWVANRLTASRSTSPNTPYPPPR